MGILRFVVCVDCSVYVFIIIIYIDILCRRPSLDGLYPNCFERGRGKITFGADGDSFYEYLIKVSVQVQHGQFCVHCGFYLNFVLPIHFIVKYGGISHDNEIACWCQGVVANRTFQ